MDLVCFTENLTTFYSRCGIIWLDIVARIDGIAVYDIMRRMSMPLVKAKAVLQAYKDTGEFDDFVAEATNNF
jgi:hypothetical protein